MSYGYCETSFVERDDQGAFRQAAEHRERARQLNKERQRELAEELSILTSEEYQDDILDHMEKMEV
jgi:hypothetical protein